LSDEKSMHDIPVDTHTSHLITELWQRTKGNIWFQLHQWLQTIKKEG
jgi:hypothetical protein